MAENNEAPSSSSEGIIDKIKDFVSSSIAKIASSVKNAVTKLLDMVENKMTIDTKTPTTSEPTQTTTPPAENSSAPTANTDIPTPAPENPTPEPETNDNNQAAQTEATEEDEIQNLKNKVKLVDGKISDATKKELKPILDTLGSAPTKDGVKHALMNILQNAAGNQTKKIVIPALGLEENGIHAEESAEAILEALIEGKDFTDKIDEIIIYINSPELKTPFEAAFAATTPITATPTQQAA